MKERLQIDLVLNTALKLVRDLFMRGGRGG